MVELYKLNFKKIVFELEVYGELHYRIIHMVLNTW